MARTVSSRQRSRRKWIHYGLFVLGVFMLVGGMVLGVFALQYEFTRGSTAEGADVTGTPIYDYGTLTPQEQRVTDGAIDGKRYVFESSEPIPGGSVPGLRAKEIVVETGDTRHVFTQRITFPETEPKGLATIALVVGGLLAMVEAIRRHHFPQSLPWQAS